VSRTLYTVGIAYVAICGLVLYGHRTLGPLAAASGGGEPVAPAQAYGGAAGRWFEESKGFCNTVEVDVRLRYAPPPAGAEGAGFSAACYALAGKIERAREVIEQLSGGDRANAAGIVFNIGHPVADAGDDHAAGPIMRLVIEYQPDNYMALYHAGMSEYILGQHGFAREHLERFLELYTPNDGWRSNALTVLERIR
jgi:hypothetical protein